MNLDMKLIAVTSLAKDMPIKNDEYGDKRRFYKFINKQVKRDLLEGVDIKRNIIELTSFVRSVKDLPLKIELIKKLDLVPDEDFVEISDDQVKRNSEKDIEAMKEFIKLLIEKKYKPLCEKNNNSNSNSEGKSTSRSWLH